jgi:hypothetical protein
VGSRPLERATQFTAAKAIISALWRKIKECNGLLPGPAAMVPFFGDSPFNPAYTRRCGTRGSADAQNWGKSMSNTFGTDILIQAEDPAKAASFYVKELGFEITDTAPNMISLLGKNINLFIEHGPALGPVLEVTVKNVQKAKASLTKSGCEIIKDEPEFPRCYVRDPNGLIYNLTE